MIRKIFNILRNTAIKLVSSIVWLSIVLGIAWFLPYIDLLELQICKEEAREVYFSTEEIPESYQMKNREFYTNSSELVQPLVQQLFYLKRQTIGDRNFFGKMPRDKGVYGYYKVNCIIKYENGRISPQVVYLKLDHIIEDTKNHPLRYFIQELCRNQSRKEDNPLEEIFFGGIVLEKI